MGVWLLEADGHFAGTVTIKEKRGKPSLRAAGISIAGVWKSAYGLC